MKIVHPEKRLFKFWGKVDKKYVDLIGNWVEGKMLLDVGCGYGTTSGLLSARKELTCIGIDIDEEALALARSSFPGVTYQNGDCARLEFPENYFDCIVLRDVLHHLKGEADIEQVIKELVRVARPNARLIVLDPNVNFILRLARKIASHKDEECTFEDALKIVDRMHAKVLHKSFNTLYSLPLSGGYVGRSLVPDIVLLQRFILFSEKVLERACNALHLGRYFCWRYLVVSEIVK